MAAFLSSSRFSTKCFSSSCLKHVQLGLAQSVGAKEFDSDREKLSDRTNPSGPGSELHAQLEIEDLIALTVPQAN